MESSRSIPDSEYISFSGLAVTVQNPLSTPALHSLLAQPANDLHRPATLYLLGAAMCLVIALTYMKRALAPIGTLVQAVAAAAVVAFTISIALVLLAAALSGQ